jgi:hypothetical protein
MLSSFSASFQAGRRSGLIVPFTAEIVQSSLLAHFESSYLDSYPGSGDQWFDLQDSGYVATLEDDTYYSPDNNGIFVLDGVDDAIVIPHANILRGSINGALTIQTWTNISSYNDKDRIIEKFESDGYNLQIRANNVLQLNMNGATKNNDFFSANNAISLNQWNLITLVLRWNGGVSNPSRVFVNNTQVISGANTETSLGTNAGPLKFNAGIQVSREPVAKMGAIYIYTKELSTAEIQENFDATKGRFGL